MYKLPSDFRKKIEVTNNVVAECNLSIFDHKAKVAKSRNYRFKAKGIRNDLVLHQSSFISTPSNLMKKLTSLLNKREDEWTVKQKLLFKKKMEEKMELAKKQSQYVNKLLVQCKSWGGPVSSIEELQTTLKRHPEAVENIVEVELTYYKHTHRTEVIANPSLFKLIKISHEERLSNLFVLLNSSGTIMTAMPTNSDALRILRNIGQFPKVAEKGLDCGQLCATLWNEGGVKTWYLGYCVEVLENDFRVEHMHRIAKESNLKWRYPARPDIALVESDQILNCAIEGEWDILSNRNSEFVLKNHEVVCQLFSAIM